MKPRIDHTGKTYNRLTAISYFRTTGRRTLWRWLCSCGKESVADATAVKRGAIKSCGCLKAEVNSKRCWEEIIKARAASRNKGNAAWQALGK